MKTTTINATYIISALAAALAISPTSAAPLGTAFTYSGRLKYQGNPANGNFDLQVKLFDAVTAGSQHGPTVNVTSLAIANGLFVTALDFGSGMFDGSAYWLEIAARPSGNGPYTTLTPRQPVNPAPYSLFAPVAASAEAAAANSVTSSSIQNNAITANKIATGQVVKSVNGLSDNVSLTAGANVTLTPSGNSLTIAAANAGGTSWSLTGNSGTTPGTDFLGTTDNQALELRVNNHRGLRLEYASSSAVGVQFNSIGGSSINQVMSAVAGATISGGGQGTSHGDLPNLVQADFGTIGGGSGNTIGGPYASIAGGFGNTANGEGSFAAGELASAMHDGTFIWGDGTQVASSSGSNRFEIFASGGMTLKSPRGIFLDAADRPIITRGWDPFDQTSPGEKVGLGRWGLFMEYTQLVLGMPDTNVPGGQRSIALGRYRLDGTYDALMTIQNTDGSAWFMSDVSVQTLTIRGGADLAEPFRVSDQHIAKGSVLVIDETRPGQLKLSDRPYDTRVAGVVSGANGVNCGISIHQSGVNDEGPNVALSGRVYVLADAANGAIRPGDFLTTSSSPGHAMKVTEPARAQGAILGKAMTGLDRGQGTVLLLVTLQ
jgi:hypothetical protein